MVINPVVVAGGGGKELVNGKDTSGYYYILYTDGEQYIKKSASSDTFQVAKNSFVIIGSDEMERPGVSGGAELVYIYPGGVDNAHVFFVTGDFSIYMAG